MICLVVILLIVVIIILIAMAAAGSKKTVVVEKNDSEPISKEPDRRCPECGRGIPFDAKICPYCGKKFKEYS